MFFVYDNLKYFLLILILYTFVAIKIIDNIKLVSYLFNIIYYLKLVKLK